MEDLKHLEENEDGQTALCELPMNVKSWNKDQVKKWLFKIQVDSEDADIFYNQKINGSGLLLLERNDLKELKLSMNAIKLIICNIAVLKQKIQQQAEVMNKESCSLKPYPFNKFNAAHRYRKNSVLDVTETGPIDLIQPCHEFKAFTNTTEENRMKKYTYEVIRFAAACLNSRTNGTIHFGVADEPHGQILGVRVQNKDVFTVNQSQAIEKHFNWERSIKIAKRCVKPPRFVEVLNADMKTSGKYVIEVDIEPASIVCEDVHFNTYSVDKNEEVSQEPKGAERKKNDGKSFFIRDGSSTKNLITSDSMKEFEKHIKDMSHLSQLRREAEEKHLSVVKKSVQGSKLCEMITGGSQSMDKSHFKRYIMVANKSHPVQLENLRFLFHMNLVAVLDFDPESADNGLNKVLKETNVQLPTQYKITGAVEDIAERLQLTSNNTTSWVFCNGGIKEESPSDAENWLIEKGSSVRDVVSFLCRQDVLPPKRFLAIFLLLSQVSDGKDPLLETFSFFLQELKEVNQILCISDNESSYTYWKELIKGRCGVDISKRCIYDLSFAEVNGTVLSLWSENRKSSRFLPCGGGSKVVLLKETEKYLKTLSVLCVNQCDGGNEDKQQHEEAFYRGGKVSWWNFYFSEQPGSKPFIKRDKFNYIVDTIIPDISGRRRVCEFFSIFHLAGCGGTTLAMHVLWTLRDRFRCAVLKDDTSEDYSTIAEHVVQLLTYKTEEQPTRLPVLLLIDDFQDICDVKKLQLQIEKEFLKQNISSKSPQVIIINCMRVDSCEQADDAVFIGTTLSEKEQELFTEQLKEFEKTNTNTETFYGFMILKNNFSSNYIQGIVKNTLKGFDFEDKHAQLFAVLVLLHVYCKNALLSVSTCEEFLGLQTKADIVSCTVEDGFEKFSTLLTRCTVDSKITFEGVRVIHSSIAQHCLKELSVSHGVTKAEITNLLLTTDLFYDYTLGKQKLRKDVRSMLVKRQHSANSENTFSPLIQDIMRETPGMEEIVLDNAAKCYKKDPIIFQLLARYYYIRKQDFHTAMKWAKKAKGHSEDNSYICDTVSQVLVRELKSALRKDKEDPIKPDSLETYLTLAEKASEACKETQKTANKEAMARLAKVKDYNTFNTAGNLGELQTAATTMKILQKTPLINCLEQVLSNKMTIEDLSRKNPELRQYWDVLQKHKKYLLQIKNMMKSHFDFLDHFFVNLVPFLAEKDKPKQLRKPKIFRYFQQYTDLFCDTNWRELVKNESMNRTVKIEQTRRCLERNKGDSYVGILGYLYEEDCASTLEEIIQQYDFILRSKEATPKDIVNFIYANVILAKLNPASQYIRPYQDSCQMLHQIIEIPTSLREILPLNYITVLLLQQEKSFPLQTFVSQMKTSYLKDLKPVSNGKRAAVHFYLGKDDGYSGLISHRDINSCLGSGQDILTQWDDEKIWKQVRDSEKLYRVSGKICDGFISVEGIKVYPMFRCLLHNEYGARVTFFIGFSMNGPVALDIDFESGGSQA